MGDYYIGQKGTFSKTLIESDVYGYAGITGDFNPIHINRVEAQKSIFKKQVCHGMLTASLISTVIGTIMPGKGSVYLEQNCKFVKPVFLNDTITAEVTIVEIDEERRILTLQTDEYNQNHELVVTGNAKVKVE